ncbi:MAG: 50S ribosomal protein L1 [Nanoarchaeota archaeon]|nr:50S ribosomal protein L1 [Nanoarchaeota archaeon]MBU4123971.1 50S ribosomal protein L1 [Nanoarchaeota archaeon]
MFIEQIKQARNSTRKFRQSFDLIISLKNMDLKKPENRIKTEILLPKGLGRLVKTCIIADTLLTQAKTLENVIVLKKEDVERMNKKEVKRLAREAGAFIAEPSLMPLIGKQMGPILAPRNKMPKPVPPTISDLAPIVKRNSNSVRIALKDSPVIQLPLGTEEMSDEDINENAMAVINSIKTILPKGTDQIKAITIKTSMGKPIKVMKW